MVRRCYNTFIFKRNQLPFFIDKYPVIPFSKRRFEQIMCSLLRKFGSPFSIWKAHCISNQRDAGTASHEIVCVGHLFLIFPRWKHKHCIKTFWAEVLFITSVTRKNMSWSWFFLFCTITECENVSVKKISLMMTITKFCVVVLKINLLKKLELNVNSFSKKISWWKCRPNSCLADRQDSKIFP